jgi:hypothetical protein
MLSCLNGDVIMTWPLCTCYKEPGDVGYRSVATFNNLVSSAILSPSIYISLYKYRFGSAQSKYLFDSYM